MAAPTQSLAFLTDTNNSASNTTINQNQNKYNYYFNQHEKDDKLFHFENNYNVHCWLLPSSLSPNSDLIVSSPEKYIPSPETTDSSISNICTDFHQDFGGNQNSFEFSSLNKSGDISLEDWELTRLTVRELNQKLAVRRIN